MDDIANDLTASHQGNATQSERDKRERRGGNHGQGEQEPWNGEFYISFGDATSRSWDDARRFGFSGGGGGSWDSQTLKLLSPGDRVWVKIPKKGSVGVGTILESVQSVNEFKVQADGGEQPALLALKYADKYRLSVEDLKSARVLRAGEVVGRRSGEQGRKRGRPVRQPKHCLPTNDSEWRHTVERLKAAFPHWTDPA